MNIQTIWDVIMVEELAQGRNRVLPSAASRSPGWGWHGHNFEDQQSGWPVQPLSQAAEDTD